MKLQSRQARVLKQSQEVWNKSHKITKLKLSWQMNDSDSFLLNLKSTSAIKFILFIFGIYMQTNRTSKSLLLVYNERVSEIVQLS